MGSQEKQLGGYGGLEIKIPIPLGGEMSKWSHLGIVYILKVLKIPNTYVHKTVYRDT